MKTNYEDNILMWPSLNSLSSLKNLTLFSKKYLILSSSVVVNIGIMHGENKTVS